MTDKSEVTTEFNELVNMTAKELEEWLKSDNSQSAGWPKEDGNRESVGHESGRKIVEILESNPDRDANKYMDEQVQHMRKVVSYCKRHLTQEEKINSEESIEEVKKSKSYASLKNWGHDCLKARGASPEEKDNQDSEEKKAGEKRKAPDDQSGENKKRETHDGESEEDVEQAETDRGKKESNDENDDQADDQSEGQPAKGPQKGDTVSWKWQGCRCQAGQNKKGNTVSRRGKPDDPAVVVDTGKSEALKLSHELNETE